MTRILPASLRNTLVALGATLSLGGCPCHTPPPAGASSEAAAPTTEEQKTFYALGLLMGHNLQQLKLKPEELAFVKAGITAEASGAKPAVDLTVYGPKVQQLAMARAHAAEAAHAPVEAAAMASEKAKAKPFLDQAAKEPGASQLPSGLVLKTLTPGTGESPKETDKVKVNYEGKLIDGTIFDSSYKRGQPVTFPLKGVIPCWTEGVSHMKVGETAQLVCPSAIAYGDRGHPPTIPGGATLVFKVELISIEK